MQIQFGLVGVPNVTITVPVTREEVVRYETQNLQKKNLRPIERMAFDEARKRFASDGAEQARYFMA